MRLNDLLGREVVTTGGETLGKVHEALLVQDGPVLSEIGAAFRLHALAVSRRATGVRLGYAQGIVQSPVLLRRLFGRAPTMVPWRAIVSLTDDRVVVDIAKMRLETPPA
jgi:uncharacterized protein YrrD